MSYMHKHNAIHRDLKQENVLHDEFLYPKISDFGFSKITDILLKRTNLMIHIFATFMNLEKIICNIIQYHYFFFDFMIFILSLKF